MDLKKIENNLSGFSNVILERMGSEIRNLEEKSAKREFDKALKRNLKF